MRRCCTCGMLRAEMSSTMELVVPLLCLVVLSCSGSTSAAGAESSINRKERSDVTLSCTIPVDPSRPTSKRFVWMKDGQKEVYAYDGGFVSGIDEQFKGRVSFPGELEEGNASITITNTKVADTGNYTCESRPGHKQECRIYLRVGTASKPYITLGKASKGVRFQCDVYGQTFKIDVQLKDSNGMKIPAEERRVSEGGHYNVTLLTTVNETDTYYCEATQKIISHRITAHNHVFVPEPKEITVMEGSVNVILPCSTSGDITSKRFEWKKDGQEVYVYNGDTGSVQHEQFKDRVSVPGQLEKGNASIIIRKIKMDDAGEYTCEVPRPNKKILIILHVDKGPETQTGFSTGVVVCAVGGGVVLGICVLLAVQHCIRKMKSQSNSG